MFDRTYQPGVSATPAVMVEGECDRVQVWRPGFGWVDRLCPWHQAVVEGVMSDITDDVERTREDLTASLAKQLRGCGSGV